MTSQGKALVSALLRARRSRGRPCSWLSSSIISSSSIPENSAQVIINSSCEFSSLSENTAISERKSQILITKPIQVSNASRYGYSHHSYKALPGTLIGNSTRSPLFLSSPSSLLSQSATPFYCPNDVGIAWACKSLYSKQTLLNRIEKKLGHVDHYFHHHHQQTKKTESSISNGGSSSSNDLINLPNAISFGRLVSGPFLAWLIVQGQLQPALFGLVLAGASDWLDGYVARRKGIDSIVGTYLDPFADKVLIGCVALSMVQVGYLPSALVALVVARDTALVGGSLVQRAQSMNWKVNSLCDFFNINDHGLQKVKPIFISKINTVFQLGLVGTALIQPAFGIEDTYSLVPFLSWCVAFTTCASTVGYGWKVFRK